MLIFSVLSFIFVADLVTCSEPRLSPVVTLPYGSIQGRIEAFRDQNVYRFMGIPYAASPIGSRRFLNPQPPIPWNGVRNVTEYGKSCPQGGSIYAINRNETDEDCLFLNVFVNSATFFERDHIKRPVLFWIHGGGFKSGSGNERDAYRGIPLVVLEDVILVTINYRLNVLGFFAPGSAVPEVKGNMGLWDQFAALNWTKNNIHLFGGDPNLITIFGESAGSMSVEAHIISPLTNGLFRRAIMQSGTMLTMSTDLTASVENASRAALTRVGCSNASNPLTCLQSVDLMLLETNGTELVYLPIWGDEFLPFSSGVALQQGVFNQVDLLIGVVKDEALPFLAAQNQDLLRSNATITYQQARSMLRKFVKTSDHEFFYRSYLSENMTASDIKNAVFKAASDGFLVCSTYAFGFKYSSMLNKTASRVYGYYHTQAPKKALIPFCGLASSLGVCHTDDIPFVFGAPLREPNEYSIDDVELSLNMMNIWAEFARSGVPSKQGPTKWPRFQENGPDDLRTMELNNKYLGRLVNDRIKFCIDNLDRFLKVKLPTS